MNPREMAQALYQARQDRTPIAPLTTENPLSLVDAYAIQEMGRDIYLAEGDILCGYKMGLTSRAKQRDVQVFETIRGYLLKSMEMSPGQPVETGNRIHPRAEPEVAVVLKTALLGKPTLREVTQAISGIYPAIEIIDSRFEAFNFRLADVIADNTSASGFMVGTRNLLSELSELLLMGISVRKNGEILETGTPAAVLGNPLLAVVDLVHGLSRDGKGLEAGMVILTGGITTSVPFTKGDLIETVWPGEVLSFKGV